MNGTLTRVVLVTALVAGITGCTESRTPTRTATTSDEAGVAEIPGDEESLTSPDSTLASLPRSGLPSTTTTLVRWVDGDTAVTSEGRVRLLGMDTPERGQCGFGPATSYAGRLAPAGSTIELVAVPGDDDRDGYGRLLRYVYANSTDVGYALILAGFARARYDSRDGYGPHPHEDAYIAADEQNPNPACAG